MEKINGISRDGSGQNKKVIVISPCELDGWTESGDSQWALMVAWPNSLCGLRYPVPGQKGRANLIEKYELL